jgi:transposase
MNHPEWVIAFEDETWWSRFSHPSLHAWTDGEVKLIEQKPQKDDPDPKALACYGLLTRSYGPGDYEERILLRFVDGRAVSNVTIQFLAWSCEKLLEQGKKALLLVWDNAPWHVSKMVRGWIGEHNREVKATGKGVRILSCPLPIKSPWLNPIEPKWIHGKRRVVEKDRTLTAHETAERVCSAFGCVHEEHLTISDKVS